MLADMKRLACFALIAAVTSPAFAGASNFTLVNGTGGGLSEVSIRRVGTSDWKRLMSGAKLLGVAPPLGKSSASVLSCGTQICSHTR